MNCEFATLTKGARCIHRGCQVVLPCDFQAVPIVNCQGHDLRQHCVHRGPPKGDQVKVSCKPGCNQFDQPHECAIFKRCLPTFRGPWADDHQQEAALYHLCHGCTHAMQ